MSYPYFDSAMLPTLSMVVCVRPGMGLGAPARPKSAGSPRLQVLVRQREEQLVLEDGAGGEHAPVLAGEIEVHRDAARLVAGERIAVVGVEHRARVAVAARTHHHVDRTALEITLGDVIRGDLHGQLLDRIQRHRALGGQATLLQAEVVGVAHAIDSEAVGAVVLAGDVHAADAGIEGGEGILLHDVADVALYRGDAFDVLARVGGGRARGQRQRLAAGDAHLLPVSAPRSTTPTGSVARPR